MTSSPKLPLLDEKASAVKLVKTNEILFARKSTSKLIILVKIFGIKNVRLDCNII